MARKLGYGGLANTNGARDFSSKTAPVLARVLGYGGLANTQARDFTGKAAASAAVTIFPMVAVDDSIFL